MDTASFNHAVEYALETGNWNKFEDWILNNSSFSYGYGADPGKVFPEAISIRIEQLLNNKGFLRSQSSSKVLHFLEYDWDLLSQDQRRSILSALLTAFFDFEDRLSWFITIELICDYVDVLTAIRSLNQLTSSPDPDARSLVAYGYGRIAARIKDREIIDVSLKALQRFQNDSAEVVRAEAQAAIARIKSSIG